jgi:NADP-dependent 3-hydroxy acid dehydrogenase YdfG
LTSALSWSEVAGLRAPAKMRTLSRFANCWTDEDAEAAAKFVQEKTDKVDVLIANAGESG